MANNLEMLIPFESKEYLETARSRVTMAFEEKPVFDKFLQLLTGELEDIQEILRSLKQERTLDEAVGLQLDLIGALVGQPRSITDVDLFDYFGFEGHLKARSFGDLDNDSVGGMFFDYGYEGQDSIELPDDLYRIIIRAKILKNITRATPEDVMKWMDFVFQTKNSIAMEGGAKILALIGRRLSSEEVIILNYIERSGEYDVRLFPKPLGVEIDFGNFDGESTFAFQGISFAMGFGDIGDPLVGGKLGEVGFTHS